MKKGLIFVAAFLSMASMNAYTLKVNNKTKRQLEVEVTYKRSRICSVDKLKVMPYKSKTDKHGLCCIVKIRVKTTSGPRAGHWFEFQPTVTGYRKSCRSNTIKVSENPDNTLLIEMDEPKTKKGHWLIMDNKTSVGLEATIDYGLGGVCARTNVPIEANKTKTHKTGRRLGFGCCVTKMLIKKTSGKGAGKWYEFQPKRTGILGQSCRDNKIEITENPDHSLHIEAVD